MRPFSSHCESFHFGGLKLDFLSHRELLEDFFTRGRSLLDSHFGPFFGSFALKSARKRTWANMVSDRVDKTWFQIEGIKRDIRLRG